MFAALLVLVAAGVAASSPHLVCRVSEFGATPEGIKYSTAAIQAAIDACSGSCGTVLVDGAPGGAYLAATLHLSGCVHLHIPAGITLLAGTQREDYGASQEDWYLLHFHNCTGCSLSGGGGVVDGQARKWVLPHAAKQDQGKWQGVGRLHGRDAALGLADNAPGRQLRVAMERVKQLGFKQTLHQTKQVQHQQHQQQRQQVQAEVGAEVGADHQRVLLPRKAVRNWEDPSCPKSSECRPRLVGVVDSSHVSITGISLTDPVYWCLHVLRSSHVSIENITIRGDWDIPNNDGIDVDSSRHVSVQGADVDTADDAICLKSTAPGHPLEHVDVRGCRLRSRSSAVKLGSESLAVMRHISFADLDIADSHRGLAVQLRDGGSISHVNFRHINLTTRYYHPSWWGAAEPIYVTAVPRSPGTQVGQVHNLTFTDIQATSESGIFLAGGPLLRAGSSSSSDSTGSGSSSSGSNGGGSQQQHEPSLSGIRLLRVQVWLKKRSNWTGGCQDYRPSRNSSGGSNSNNGGSSSGSSGSGGTRLGESGKAGTGSMPGDGGASTLGDWWWPAGLDCSGGSTAAVWVAGAEAVLLKDVQLHYCPPWRDDWRQAVVVDAYSTRDVVMRHVTVSNASAGSTELRSRIEYGGCA